MSAQERRSEVKEEEGATLALTPDRILSLLSEGEIEVEGLVPWSSNATLLVTVRDDDISTLAVYKPQKGERPLWDFPYGTLALREVASYLVCESLGWGLVPPTVLRQGPHGLGSVQFFVHAQRDAHYFTIQEDPAYDTALKRLAVFDLLANNADRKSGHCLVDQQGRLWAIDNALTFHAEYKLRTVIWEYVGQPLPELVKADLRALLGIVESESGLSEVLSQLLSDEEWEAFRLRLLELIELDCFPEPGPGYAVPWPLV